MLPREPVMVTGVGSTLQWLPETGGSEKRSLFAATRGNSSSVHGRSTNIQGVIQGVIEDEDNSTRWLRVAHRRLPFLPQAVPPGTPPLPPLPRLEHRCPSLEPRLAPVSEGRPSPRQTAVPSIGFAPGSEAVVPVNCCWGPGG